MFQIVITPPEESRTAAQESESQAVAELRALGVSARLLDLAVARDSSQRPPAFVPALQSTSRPASLPPTSPLERFECMRIDATAMADLSSEQDTTATTAAAATDEAMVEDTDCSMSPPEPSPPVPMTVVGGTLAAVRIPSALFKRLHTDADGFLLPPVANPDLAPNQLERADSFWIPEGERTLDEHWEKQQMLLLDPAGTAAPTSLIAASKTKSVYASALVPRAAVPASSHLIDDDDWTSVLDATVIVAHHELSRPMHDSSPVALSPGHDDTQSLKRKHLSQRRRSKNKHMRVQSCDSSSSAYSSAGSSPTTHLSPPQAGLRRCLQAFPAPVPSADSDSASHSSSSESDDDSSRHSSLLRVVLDAPQDAPMDEAGAKGMQID